MSLNDPHEEFLRDIEDYYGNYKGQHREVVLQYIKKRFFADDLQLLKKYVYENLHANYGAPAVSGYKTVERTAYKEDGFRFKKPARKRDGVPMLRCNNCENISPIDSMKCPYCGEFTSGNSKICVPEGFFG